MNWVNPDEPQPEMEQQSPADVPGVGSESPPPADVLIDPATLAIAMVKLGVEDTIYTGQPPSKEGLMQGFSLSSITAAQFVGIVSAVVNTALAFGLTLSATQQHVIIADAGIAAALIFGDSIVAHARAKAGS